MHPLGALISSLAAMGLGRLPHIRLHCPEMTRPLTAERFARRVDERYPRCRGKGTP